MSAASSLHPRIVLITGASSGIGRATALCLLEAGVRVIPVARRIEPIEELRQQFGPELVLPIQLDMQDAAGIAAAIEGLPGEFQAVDCLVNNAGLALGLAPSESAELDDWDQMIATNCRGLVHMTRALLPRMVANGRGHIVNLGSVAGSYPYPGGNVYGATKAFVRQFSLNLRCDLHGSGVRVTNIEPGICGGTEFSTVRFGGDAQKAEGVYAGMKPLSPGDVAQSILWAVSLPPHVNVNSIELMPVAQSFAPFAVSRSA